jgi:hypothetical protein
MRKSSPRGGDEPSSKVPTLANILVLSLRLGVL